MKIKNDTKDVVDGGACMCIWCIWCSACQKKNEIKYNQKRSKNNI